MLPAPRHVAAIAAYVGVIVVPLLVAVAPPRPEGRGVAIEVGAAVGAVSSRLWCRSVCGVAPEPQPRRLQRICN